MPAGSVMEKVVRKPRASALPIQARSPADLMESISVTSMPVADGWMMTCRIVTDHWGV